MQTQKIHSLLKSLSKRRPVFHSEADFQHALAWQMQLADPEAQIRLEKQVAAQGARVHLDLLVQSKIGEIAIELKYKTRRANLNHAEEEYFLRNQSAQDIGRYDFLKDIQRLEEYVNAHANSEAFAIFLTNAPTYWVKSNRNDTVDSEFRIHEDQILQGSLTWGEKASEGTKRNREESIKLQGKYKIHWHNYPSLWTNSAEGFRYVLLRVPPVSPS
jgi:hypothetical protein